MPAPAVFIPRDQLDGLDLATLGFVSVIDRDENANIPISRHLAADVMSTPAGMNLMIFDKQLPLKPKSILKVHPSRVLEGSYDTVADESWQNEAYNARRLLVLAGPRPDQDSTDPAAVFQWLLSPDSVLAGLTLRALS